MAEHAQLKVGSATTAAGRTSDRRTGDAAELSRLIVDLLSEQIRYSLELAVALGQMAAWERIVRTQAGLVCASVAWWSRSNPESAARPGRKGSALRHEGELPVRAVMKRPCSVLARPDETVQAAVVRMTAAICGSVLVCGDDGLCGLFTERDLVTRVLGKGLDPRTTRLKEVMTRDPDRIESTASTREALRRLDGVASYHLPVVEGDRALGVVSLHDLPLETLAEMLPELEQRRVLAERMW